MTSEEISESIARLRESGWSTSRDGKAITKTYRFADFSAAFAWMVRVAMAAEKLNHHPDWTNVYNRVEVTLTTHSKGGLTGLDIRLAKAMDRLTGDSSS